MLDFNLALGVSVSRYRERNRRCRSASLLRSTGYTVGVQVNATAVAGRPEYLLIPVIPTLAEIADMLVRAGWTSSLPPQLAFTTGYPGGGGVLPLGAPLPLLPGDDVNPRAYQSRCISFRTHGAGPFFGPHLPNSRLLLGASHPAISDAKRRCVLSVKSATSRRHFPLRAPLIKGGMRNGVVLR